MKPKIPLPPDAVTESGLADTTGMAPAIAAARGVFGASPSACTPSTP